MANNVDPDQTQEQSDLRLHCLPSPVYPKTKNHYSRFYRNDSTFFDLGKQFRRYEPSHDKTNKMSVRPAKTQISMGIRPVWSESSLSAWRNLGSLATHWEHSENSDQTGRVPRLLWVFTGRTLSFVMSRPIYSYMYTFLPSRLYL